MSGEPTTVQSLIEIAAGKLDRADLFFGHGTDNAYDEAAWIAFDILGLDHSLADSLATRSIDQAQADRVLAVIEQRIRTREPAAYLTGKAWFCGLPFAVDKSVLIPRSPIAELIERAYAPWTGPGKVGALLDLCTGSGCIAIASSMALPGASVTASDISDQALDIARQNAVTHGVDGRIRFVKSDVFDQLAGETYDIIVSNPPYVSREEMDALPEEFRHEPALGLAAGESGIDIAARILDGATGMLNPGGLLIVEVGNSRARLEQAYPRLPFTWLEFEHGGEGVFLLYREQLEAGKG